MANNKSRIKTIKKVKVLTLRNKIKKSTYKTLEKKLYASFEAGDKDASLALLDQVVSKLDKMAKTHTIHKSKADRKKSRLTVALNKAFA
jgi:small subunit ribosomal protein S20